MDKRDFSLIKKTKHLVGFSNVTCIKFSPGYRNAWQKWYTGWKAPLQVVYSKLSAQSKARQSTLLKTISSQIFNFFRDQGSTVSLAILLLDTEYFFFLFKSCFFFLISIFVHCLSSCHWLWIVRRSSFKSPLGYFSLLICSPWTFSSSYWTVPDLSALLVMNPSFTAVTSFGLGPLYTWVFFVLLTPGLDPTLQMCLTRSEENGKNTLPDVPGISFLM